MRDGFSRALIERMGRHEEIVVLDGDVANSTKTDKVFEAYPDRFVAAGIAEQNMAGVAAGLASTGKLVPFVVTFAVFAVSRMLDQVRVSIAQTGLPVVVVGAYAGLLTGKTGKTHISVDDLAVYRALPGMRVLAPADDEELEAALDLCLSNPAPTYLRVARDPVPTVTNGAVLRPEGSVLTLRAGTEVALVGTGSQSGRCLQAADLLSEWGLEAAVLHVPQLKPIAHATVREPLERFTHVFTVEEHNVIGGLGSLVAEALSERPWGGYHLRLGIQDRFGESGANDDLLHAYGLSSERVARAVADGVRARS
ncbi:MAG TPA: transketolase C-terminal domain-containing protein [Trueperaceae bacterium]|nr:transketolase C-terminal domain-containing protein [Trueperaceae bacterium]